MQCKWRRKLDTDWTLYDDKIVVNQLRHFFFFFLMMRWLLHFVLKVSDLMNQWQSGFMILVHPCIYFWTTSQARLELVWITAGDENSSETSLLVLQYNKLITSEYRNHWEALTVAEASMSQWPLSIRDFHVSLHVVDVDSDVLLCESKLSESIAVVIGMEGMASVLRNVHRLLKRRKISE